MMALLANGMRLERPIQLGLYDNQRFQKKKRKYNFFSEILSLLCLPPNGRR